MMKIDAYAHFAFPRFIEFLERHSGRAHDYSKLFANTRPLIDAEARLNVMDALGVEKHVLVPLPEIGSTPEVLANPRLAMEAAHICNDQMAELVARHPDRFIGVAMLPLTSGEALAEELARAVSELGLVGGVFGLAPTLMPPDHPEFEALWQTATSLDVPLWMHPARSPSIPECFSETRSKYQFFQAYTWLLDTTMGMHRIACSGVFVRFPELKIIAHHHGALIPQWHGRADVGIRYFEACAGVDQGMAVKPPLADQYRHFYIDTATHFENPDVLRIAVDFFGTARTLFGSDAPMDAEGGLVLGRNADRSVARLGLSEADLSAVYAGNAERLLRLGEGKR